MFVFVFVFLYVFVFVSVFIFACYPGPQVTYIDVKEMPRLLGKCANNQNGNLRWHLP